MGANWPAMSLEEVDAKLCAPGAQYEMETIDIRGVPTRVWKNQSPNIATFARRARGLFAPQELVVFEDERVTYEGWFRASAIIARRLQASGIGKGDRVAIAMRNYPEWISVFFGITSIGAIAVPLNAWWKGSELSYALSDSGSALLISDVARWEEIKPLHAEFPALREIWLTRANGAGIGGAVHALESFIGSPSGYGDLSDADLPDVAVDTDDDATIFYTSGTTGHPKGALGTHRNILTCAMTAGYSGQRTSWRRGEAPQPSLPRTTLLVIPLFHATGCHSALMNTINAGGKLVMMRKWDTVAGMQLIEREKINSTGGVPTIPWQLIEHPERDRYDLSSLEIISYGGAPSAPELVRKINSDLKVFPGQGWGMTETSGTVTVHGAEDYLNRPDSCGPPVSVADIRVMSEDGTQVLPRGEVGELWARGPMIVKGYWNKPEATAETFIDGWVRTGDLARIDAEGFCFIVDRAKDIIIRGGENIYSSEVENVMYEHPAVTDAALVGMPHRTLGEVPGAVVHLAPGASADEAELREWVRVRLAAFKVPERVLFLPEPLPRNANGKILKKQLKGLFG